MTEGVRSMGGEAMSAVVCFVKDDNMGLEIFCGFGGGVAGKLGGVFVEGDGMGGGNGVRGGGEVPAPGLRGCMIPHE